MVKAGPWESLHDLVRAYECRKFKDIKSVEGKSVVAIETGGGYARVLFQRPGNWSPESKWHHFFPLPEYSAPVEFDE
jgi:hypothetical protein